MKLYLIKRRSDGKFLRTLDVHYSLHSGQDKTAWSDTPQMLLKTPDGVVGNLRKLCSEPYFDGKWPYREVAWRNFDVDKLDRFEVVCMDVDVISMTATPAKEFAQIEAIARVPLTRKERRAA
jgi:hypothetical protein